MDDPCNDLGGGVPPICIKVTRSYTWCLKSYTKGVHQKWSFKCQLSTPMQAFASIRSTPFMKIDDKWGEIVQRYESFGKDWDKEVEVVHGHGQRGSNIEGCERIKILGQEKHTSRWSKLMNFDWLHLICAFHMFACMAQVLNFNIHACVVSASCRFEW